MFEGEHAFLTIIIIMILNSFYRFWVNRESIHDTPRIKFIYSFADILLYLQQIAYYSSEK